MVPWSKIVSAAAIVGVIAHIAITAVAGNHLLNPWSGGGDIHQYADLASNLLAGDGFTFAHQPTAFRAPLYPLLLALLMRISANYWLMILHVLQLLISFATALLCGKLAERWFGRQARYVAIAGALVLPTLLYVSSEVLTECTAAFLGILFVLLLDRCVNAPRTDASVLLGVVCGLAALERFNAAVLVIAACIALLVYAGWRQAFMTAAACLLIVTPWLIHTEKAFHGNALYSTHGGFAAVEGVLSPTGRADQFEVQEMMHELGWGNWNVETNTPEDPRLRDEVALNQHAWHVTFGLWKERGWGLVPIAGSKLAAFWLSTDQVFHSETFSWKNRLLRWAGVGVYWIMLVAAILGWVRLRKTQPKIAYALLIYVVAATAMHVPVTMNTRLRVPLFDPLVVALASGGFAGLVRYP
jgi:hypothetical protein